MKDALRSEPRFDDPSCVLPSKNDTVPVGDGEPVADEISAAVKVTLPPMVCGLVLEEMVIAVEIGAGCRIVS